MTTRAALVTVAVAAGLALVPATSAQAAPKPAVNLDGSGPFTVRGGDVAVATGRFGGTPFAGRFAAALQPQDGTLPEPGVCEPAQAALRIDGTGGRYAVLYGPGEVCGTFTDSVDVVSHIFTATYDVVATSQRKLRGGDGWLEIRLATDGRATVTAFDS